MLYPIDSTTRETKVLDGLWEVKPDPKRQGIKKRYQIHIPDGVCSVAVPASVNEQFADWSVYHSVDWVWYFRKFFLPKSWEGKRVFLRFGSVNYRAEVFCNGKKIGAHEGGYEPFEFELSRSVLSDEENLLVVRVDNLLGETTVPQGNLNPRIGGVAAWRPNNFPLVHWDYFPYTGIHRPVVLYATAASRFERIRLTTKSIRSGRVRVKIEGTVSGNADSATITIRELNFEKKMRVNGGVFSSTASVESCTLWSPENPRLYTVEMYLGNGGETVDHYRLDYGFRTVAVRRGRLLLNGTPVFLKGFGKHEDCRVSGKGLNLPYAIKDYSLLRWIGANSFRTSHYPYAEEMMQLADREGVMVIDEVAANTLSMKAVATSKKKKQALIAAHTAQIETLIDRDYNHPSVIAWSLGNECETYIDEAKGYYRDMVAFAKQHDSSRPVTFVLNSSPKREKEADSFDIICINIYPGWYNRCGQIEHIRAAMKERIEGFWKKYRKPVLLSEFGAGAIEGMHSEYPVMWSEEYQAAVLHEIITVAQEYPYVMGTHIWAFADFNVGQDTGRIILNRKGVFTRERYPKMAAHDVRALWTGTPKR
jgi:beta-glucuronidase